MRVGSENGGLAELGGEEVREVSECCDIEYTSLKKPSCFSSGSMREWVLTPSLRVATFSHLNKHGGEVLVESDGKTKLCCHGEHGSSIRTWLHAESQARAEGRQPPARNSPCDCQTTVGLQNSTQTRPPPPPASVYELLASMDGDSIDVSEQGKAYCLGAHKAYLSASGMLYCAHSHRLKTRTRAARPCVWTAGACGCRLVLPRRMPHLYALRRTREVLGEVPLSGVRG